MPFNTVADVRLRFADKGNDIFSSHSDGDLTVIILRAAELVRMYIEIDEGLFDDLDNASLRIVEMHTALKAAEAIITRFFATENMRFDPRHPFVAEKDRIVGWLRNISTGKTSLTGSVPGESNHTVAIKSRARVFTDEVMSQRG